MQELHAAGVRPIEIAVMCQINEYCLHDQFLLRPSYLSIQDVVAIGIIVGLY